MTQRPALKKPLPGGRALLVALLCACLLALAPVMALAEGEGTADEVVAVEEEAPEEAAPEEGIPSVEDESEPGEETEEVEPVDPMPVERPLPTILAWGHGQTYGDLTVAPGADGVSGTIGKVGASKRLEAFSLKLQQVTDVDGTELAPLDGSIVYRAYVNGAWQEEKCDGQVAGTTGQGLPIQGVSIRLTDALADEYDVYYRVHLQSYGWLAWACNGEMTGALDYGKRAEAIQVVLVKHGNPAPTDAPDTDSVLLVNRGVFGTAHCQTYGWMPTAMPGERIGTTGKSKRLEAVKLTVKNLEGVGITYQVHSQTYGWKQGWVSDGQTAGTTGQSKRIEAVQIKLTGENADKYHVYYRVHCQTLGTLGWAKDGETAGTTGLSLRAEAIEVVIVPDGQAATGSTNGAYVTTAGVTYASNVAGSWQSSTSGTSGTTGQSKPIYQIKMALSGERRPSGTVQYRLHIAGTGWTGWYNEGTVAGTSGKNVQAIQVRLTGTMASLYDVYYRGYVQSFGWGGWAKNSASAGSTGISKRMEAFEVRLVRKGGSAPGSTANACRTTVMPSDAMGKKAWTQSSSTAYLVMVDRANCKVGVYTGYTGNWKRIQYWTVSVGASSSPTVTGTFTVGSRGYSFGHGYTCYYWTQFYGDYLFHSVLYNQGTRTIQDGRLGYHISHGCVRMDINAAKWIYDNVPRGSRVVVY